MQPKPFNPACSLLVLLLLCLAGILAPLGAGAQNVSVRALVEKDTVSESEPFLLQIHVEGQVATAPSEIDTSAIRDFAVEPLGRESNNRSSITIINGQMKRVESRGTIESFRLTPKRSGQLAIPPLVVSVDGRKMSTESISIRVTPPEKTDDIRLELKFSKTRIYVGEPVTLTVTWYLARDVESVAFQIPALDQTAFLISDPKGSQDPARKPFQLPLGQGKVSAEKGSRVLGGRNYTTLTFEKIVIPTEAGTFDLPAATVSCRVVAGYARSDRRRTPFDLPFQDDFFGAGRKEVYKTLTAQSDPVVLTVLSLPREGVPPHFTGAVGNYSLEAAANPTAVGVGDPITLMVSVRGQGHLDNVELPSLNGIPALADGFKIPEEMAAGVVTDGAKTFTQTVRAKSDAVKEIPAVPFGFFNPEAERYEVAQSRPIALQVKASRIVTESDVEGRPVQGRGKSELEAWSQGIAHNYEGPDVLVHQRVELWSLARSPVWLGALLLPAVLYGALLMWVRRRDLRTVDPEGFRSRRAWSTFQKRVQELRRQQQSGAEISGALLDAMRRYLGDKLGCQGSSLTFAEVEKRLEDRRTDSATMDRLRDIFESCEEARYGGGCRTSKSGAELLEEVLQVSRMIEKGL
jgi:hypothetical protein